MKLIQAIARHELITLPPDLAEYAEQLGLGDFNTGIV